MAKKEAKFRDGNKTMTVTIDDVVAADEESPAPDVEAYQEAASSETFSITNPDGRVLTITIAE
ncbi:MAG: hypothetical protein ACR2IH_03045 [Pyrinomonadaceae bacterium]